MATIQKCAVGSGEWKHGVKRMRSTIMEHENQIPLANYSFKEVSKLKREDLFLGGLAKRF